MFHIIELYGTQFIQRYWEHHPSRDIDIGNTVPIVHSSLHITDHLKETNSSWVQSSSMTSATVACILDRRRNVLKITLIEVKSTKISVGK